MEEYVQRMKWKQFDNFTFSEDKWKQSKKMENIVSLTDTTITNGKKIYH